MGLLTSTIRLQYYVEVEVEVEVEVGSSINWGEKG
jgi:hypothetical protein